ncbi:MAG: two-component system sensor histidine kinase NtrB, partial [Candidatus Acidiferrum sp.]
DVTRQRSLEHELERSQRLELVGRMVSGIAHDFNNMLTVILNLAEHSRDALPEDHAVRADLRRIVEAGEHASSLATQLLACGRLRRGPPGVISLNRLAHRTLDLLRASLPNSIRVESSLEGPDLRVEADETQLQQVLMNLLLNAREAMPSGGQLRVCAEEVAAPSPSQAKTATNNWVRLTVDDSGEGMGEEVIQKIFDPFFTTKERGTGLGLTVVRQIIENYGGRVTVSSQAGTGARFEIWLPRSDASRLDESAAILQIEQATAELH